MQPNSIPRVHSPQVIPGPNSRPTPGGRISPDTGCCLSASCLRCWLPKCVHDMTPHEVRELRNRSPGLDTAARLQTLMDRGVGKHVAVKMLAAQDGVGVRAVYRRLSECREATS